MTVRRIQDDGDIATSGTQFLTDAEEIAQTIKTRLKLFSGEYFRNILDGTAWFEVVLGKGQPLELKEAVIKRRIIQTQGVASIFKFDADFDLNPRQYSISAGVVTPFGPVDLNIPSVV